MRRHCGAIELNHVQPKRRREIAMTRLRLQRRQGSIIGSLLIVVSLVTIATGDLKKARRAERARSDSSARNFLFVWAGDQARQAPDFLAVIDFDETSANYGKVITTLPLPGPGASGNEPHHVGLSKNGKVLACGGLLSVLKGQKEIFFFDVSNPTAPTFMTAADPPLSAITDEFYALPEGGFLVTMMGGANGAHPGRVAEFNKDLELVSEHPGNAPQA